jgi:NAD(P)-dependent dehydrogenase (short-subunit alcohol dehydrogenase family)
MTWTIEGRTCLVTGATSGIGRAAAIELARRGARLVLVARDRGRAEATLAEIAERTGNRETAVVYGDLSSFAAVRKVAADYLATDRRLDVLVNNAGLVMDRREITADGLETTLAVNHYAPFLLTNLLLPRLRGSAPARIVTVSSMGHKFAGRIDVERLEPRRFGGMHVYCVSKLCNVLFTRELARRLEGSGVTAHSVHPGNVATRFGQNTGGILNWGSRLIARMRRSPEKGAETVVHLCCADDLGATNGEYWYDRRVARTSEQGRDGDLARRLWTASERVTGLSAPA